MRGKPLPLLPVGRPATCSSGTIALHHRRPAAMGPATRHLRRLSLDGWNGEDGVIERFATSAPRDLAEVGRTRKAAAHG